MVLISEIFQYFHILYWLPSKKKKSAEKKNKEKLFEQAAACEDLIIVHNWGEFSVSILQPHPFGLHFAVPGGRRWCVFWSLTLQGRMRVFPDPRCPARGPLWQSTPCASRTPPPPYSEEKSSSSGRMALLLRCTKPEGCTVYSHEDEGVLAKRRTVSCGWLCNVLSLLVKREIK